MTVGMASGISARGYNRILGSNDRMNVAIFGCYRRFGGLASSVVTLPNSDLLYVSDVDARRQEAAIGKVAEMGAEKPKGESDFRVILENPDIDAVFVAIPDHWHAAASLMAMEAGKHVYVEKPCSHNPHESELLVHFQQYHNKVVQMGNQQRSAPSSQEVMKAIHAGEIGEVYSATAFYTNRRGRVPNRTQVEVPGYLNWELFQGPAPRRPYFDILGDYNWHWDWHYGTAETGNNATHEIDVARWALDVKYPNQVKVNSGKYHFVDDGWPMYDTMDATFVYDNGRSIKWDGKSRSGHSTYGSGRGTIIYGAKGSVYVDRGGFKMYNRDGELMVQRFETGEEGSTNLGGGGDMTTLHVHNFFEAIRGKEKQNSPIDEGAISTNLCHYANISSRLGDITLEVNKENGKIRDKGIMDKFWSRDYEPGWELPAM